MTETIRIAALSIGPANHGYAPIMAEAERGIRRAAAAGARLVVLPELFACPYVAAEDPARWPHLAERPDGPTVSALCAIAEEADTAILFGLPLRLGNGLPYNAAVLAAPSRPPAVAALKAHLPPRGPADRFGEADHFTPGATHPIVLRIGEARLATLVCYDRRIPGAWENIAAAGADVVAVLIAGPAPDDPPGHDLALLGDAARRHGLAVIAAARTGTETVTGRPVRHDGVTAAIAPDGTVVAVAESRPGAIATLDVTPHHLSGLYPPSRRDGPSWRRGGAETNKRSDPWEN
jgi:N-carbamoylputrescine amidase